MPHANRAGAVVLRTKLATQIGTGWPVNGLMAWPPVNTPSLGAPSAVRSIFPIAAIRAAKASTSALREGVVRLSTIG